MRSLLAPALFALSLALACNAADRDPAAATKAANAAAGAIKPLTADPSELEVHKGPKGGLPHPGGPGDFKPPPVEKGATCIVDDGDADTPNTPPQRTPPKKPKGPIGLPDPGEPHTKAPVEKSASAGPGAPAGGDTRRAAKAAPGGPAPMEAERLDYASMCEEKMSDSCSSLCRSKGLTWDASAGNNGTCVSTSSSTNDSGATITTTECGCMCK